MGKFIGELEARAVRDTAFDWELLAPLTYCTDEGLCIHVPKGFVTDLASVPIGFRNIVSRSGRIRLAAVIHDYLYHTRPAWCTRKEADKIFLEAMKASGMGLAQRRLAYRAVRVGGWNAWR